MGRERDSIAIISFVGCSTFFYRSQTCLCDTTKEKERVHMNRTMNEPMTVFVPPFALNFTDLFAALALLFYLSISKLSLAAFEATFHAIRNVVCYE